MNKEELENKIKSLREEEAKFKKQLKLIEYEDRLLSAEKFKGMCFIQNNKHHKEFIICLYVFDVNKENCELKSIEINYSKNNELSWFGIDYNHNFNPDRSEDFEDKWTKIDKEEFNIHYEHVQGLINKAFCFND